MSGYSQDRREQVLNFSIGLYLQIIFFREHTLQDDS